MDPRAARVERPREDGRDFTLLMFKAKVNQEGGERREKLMQSASGQNKKRPKDKGRRLWEENNEKKN